jgi:Integrase core domain
LHGNDYRLTTPNHPWTNGQAERMNRTIREATLQRCHYDCHNQLRTHLGDFVAACNFAEPLKTIGRLTACEYICKCCQKNPTDLLSIRSSDAGNYTPNERARRSACSVAPGCFAAWRFYSSFFRGAPVVLPVTPWMQGSPLGSAQPVAQSLAGAAP